MVFSLFTIACLKPHPREKVSRGGMLQSLKEGLGFVFSRQVLLGAMSLDLFAGALRRGPGAPPGVRRRLS